MGLWTTFLTQHRSCRPQLEFVETRRLCSGLGALRCVVSLTSPQDVEVEVLARLLRGSPLISPEEACEFVAKGHAERIELRANEVSLVALAIPYNIADRWRDQTRMRRMCADDLWQRLADCYFLDVEITSWTLPLARRRVRLDVDLG